MNTGQLAELIAAGFFALGMCAVVYVMIRLGRLISASTRMVSDYRDRADLLLLGAQSAVDRASEQLDRTDAITASMDDVTANMADLSGHVSAMAGLARAISGGFGAPLLRISALAYGLRRATGLRLGTQAPGGQAGRPRVPAGPPQVPALEQPVSHDQPGTYDQHRSYDQPGHYDQHRSYDQPGHYDQHGRGRR